MASKAKSEAKPTDPRGKIVAEGARYQDQIVTADLDLDLIAEVHQAWPFYRDCRPDLYGDLVKS